MKTLLRHVFLILLGLLAFSSSLILHHRETNGKSLLKDSIARLDDELARNNVTKYSRIVGVQVALGLPLSDRNPPRFKRAKRDNGRLKRGIQVPLNKPSSVNNEIGNDGIIKRIKRKSYKDKAKAEKDEKKQEDKTELYLLLFIIFMFVLLSLVVFCLFCVV